MGSFARMDAAERFMTDPDVIKRERALKKKIIGLVVKDVYLEYDEGDEVVRLYYTLANPKSGRRTGRRAMSCVAFYHHDEDEDTSTDRIRETLVVTQAKAKEILARVRQTEEDESKEGT